jgi:Holliday junction resolvasome RuvABC endonuclease subunit
MLAIAFDPSIVKTGWCVALDGKVVDIGIIKVNPKMEMNQRLEMLGIAVRDLAERVIGNGGAWIDLCLVEEFEKRTDRPNLLSMIKCATAAGLIYGLMIKYAREVRLVNKYFISKDETRWLAIDRGIITKDAPASIQDALDAYQLLVCEGICK